jgi:hypothetical protein
VAGACLVQRINGPLIAKGGARVRITLLGLASQTTRLDRVFISKAVAATAPQPWDAAAPLVEVKFNGQPGVVLQNGQPGVSDPATFPVVQGQDLLITFDVNPASQNPLRRSRTGPQFYSKANTAEAKDLDRTAGYSNLPLVNANIVYWIDKIEVA